MDAPGSPSLQAIRTDIPLLVIFFWRIHVRSGAGPARHDTQKFQLSVIHTDSHLAQISSRFPRFSFCLLNCPPTFLNDPHTKNTYGLFWDLWLGGSLLSLRDIRAHQIMITGTALDVVPGRSAALPAYFCDLARRRAPSARPSANATIYLYLSIPPSTVYMYSPPKPASVLRSTVRRVGPAERPTEPHQPAQCPLFPRASTFVG